MNHISMLSTNTTTTDYINDTRLSDLRGVIRQLGRESAMGKDSRMKLAIKLAAAAKDGVIDEDDVKELYGDYVSAESSKAIHEHTVNGQTANMSKVRQIVRAALVPALDFPHTLEVIVEVRDSYRQTETKIKPAFDCAVAAAREQLKDPLTDLVRDKIEELCVKGEPEAKDMIAKLCDEYKKLYSLTNKANEESFNGSPQIETAMHAIGDAIKEAGGELPAVTKAEKELATLVVKAAKFGIKITQ